MAQTQTHQAVLRSAMGATKEKAVTPAALGGFQHLYIPMGPTAAQTVGGLPANARIVQVYACDPPPSQGTFRLQLAAVTTPSLAAVDVVAAGAAVAVAAKTVAAASLLKAWPVERAFVATVSGGAAGETLHLIVQIVPDDTGKYDQ